jgi:hypothetical protein
MQNPPSNLKHVKNNKIQSLLALLGSTENLSRYYNENGKSSTVKSQFSIPVFCEYFFQITAITQHKQ